MVFIIICVHSFTIMFATKHEVVGKDYDKLSY